MKVKATFAFEFTPTTSGLSPELEIAARELEYMLDSGGLTPEDFDIEVVDD